MVWTWDQVAQSCALMATPSQHGLGGRQRIENSFLSGFGHCLEEQIDARFSEYAMLDEVAIRRVRDAVGGAECQHNITAAIAPE
jgi:hypothetical protein